jgi:hypothetical protein
MFDVLMKGVCVLLLSGGVFHVCQIGYLGHSYARITPSLFPGGFEKTSGHVKDRRVVSDQ